MNNKEEIKVEDNRGFIYRPDLVYDAHNGITTAWYKGRIIGQVSLGGLREPFGDNDAEWEAYEERLSEWKDEIKSNIIPICQEYFSNSPSLNA
jgi:hypothetical protein